MTIGHEFKTLSLLLLFLWLGRESLATDDMLRSANHRRLALTIDATSNYNVEITIPTLGPVTSTTDDANIYVVEFGVLPSGTAFTATLTSSNSENRLDYLLRNTGPVDADDKTGSSDSGTATSATNSGVSTGTKLFVGVAGYGTSGLTNGKLRVTAVTPAPTAAPVAPTPPPTPAPTQAPTAGCTPAPGCGLAASVWNYVRGAW